jgi:Double-GTPase 1
MTQVSKRKVRRLNNEIRILGARKAGKTTYLAALLRLPEELRRQFPGLEVSSSTEEAEKLTELAKNILEMGAALSPTDIGDEPDYAFRIKIPASRGLPGSVLNLVAKDYAGELFEHIGQPHRRNQLSPYFEEWCSAQGWMIMLTDWQRERDEGLYVPVLSRLLMELSERAVIKPELQKLRIAVVMSKCERGELWPCRLDPEEDLFKVRLPKTYHFLKHSLPTERLQFFACSVFGVISDRPGDRDPRPNRYSPDASMAEAATYLIPAYAKDWKPYGLISPLYWLSTGRRLHDERL